MTGDGHDPADGSPARSRQLYHAISGDRTTVIIETDLAGNVRWVSPTVQDLLGWTPDDLRAMHPSELLHPLDFDRINTIQRLVVAEGTVHDAVQCMMRTADDHYRNVSLRSELQYDADGQPIGVITSLSDTHDRDSALRALATLSQANRTLVRATDEAELLQLMCETIVDTGRYLFAWYGRPADDADKLVLPIAMAGAGQGYLDEVTISWADNEFGRGPTGRSIRERQTRVSNNHVPDPDFHPWLGAAERRGFHASISLPVLTNDVLDGALVVYANEVGAFDSLAQDLLEDLAADLGYGLQRLRDVADLVRTTREAEEQRERLQATLDSQFDPFIVLEAVRDDEGHLIDLRYAEANSAALTYNQMTRAEMIGARLLDLFPGQLESGPMKLYFEAIETGEPVILDDYSYGNERLESDRRYDIRAVRSGDGVALTWRDVTNRHAAAQRLADSERRFRLLAENSSDVVLLSDSGLRITWISQSVQSTFGFDPDEVIGHTAADFLHPDDVARLTQTIADSDDQGATARLRYRWRCADGTYRWVESAGRPIDDDGTGRPGRVVGMRDIDAQVRVERDLAAREERYRLLAENASDVVWQIEPDGRMSWASPSVTRVLGWSPDELIGRVGMDLIHADDRDRAIANRENVLAGSAFEGEYRVLRQDGGLRWMALAVHPVETPHGIMRIVALRDVHDEVAARQRLEFALGHDQLTGLTTRHGVIDRIVYVQAQLTRWHLVGCSASASTPSPR